MVDQLPSSPTRILRPETLQKLKVLKRFLRILENVTFMNQQNQIFLISHKGCALLHSCGRLMSVFQDAIAACHRKMDTNSSSEGKYPRRRPKSARKDTELNLTEGTERAMTSSFSDLIRLLCNLSHENELCCTKLAQLPGFLENCINMATCKIPELFSKHNQFDLMLLILSLVVNMVEYCNANRRLLLSLKPYLYCAESGTKEKWPVLDALIKMFLKHEAKARAIDEEVDRELDNAGTQEPKRSSTCDQQGGSFPGDKQDSDSAGPVVEKERELTNQEIQEIMEEVMTKAGTHMEDSIAASYFALLVGCLIQQNEEEADKVKELLPGKNFKPMIEALNKFLEFMQLANSHGNTKSISKIIEVLENLDSTSGQPSR